MHITQRALASLNQPTAHLFYRKGRGLLVKHRMAIRAHGAEILNRIRFPFTLGQRVQVMNMDETLSNVLAVPFAEVKIAYLASSPPRVETSLAETRVSLSPVYDCLLGTSFTTSITFVYAA
jgi:hypothetical protein